MVLGQERSEMAHIYFPENTDSLIFFQIEVGQRDKTALQNEQARINLYS